MAGERAKLRASARAQYPPAHPALGAREESEPRASRPRAAEDMGARRVDPLEPIPLVRPGHDDTSLTRYLSRFVLTRRRAGWWGLLLLAVTLLGLFVVAVGVTVFIGVGTWGNNIPVGWAFGITNFVWWIGIGHAGTLISAILLLFQQKWRTSINRFAEAMTLFAVMCAGLFPLLHLGRPWFFYWLVPYPGTMRLRPQFRSP